jgi:hypothetical protein
MTTQINLEAKRVLIVIPDWGLAWYMFCLEHAVELSKSGTIVSILDLSKLNPVIFRRRFWSILLGLVQKHRFKDVKQKVADTYGINLIRFKLPKLKHAWCSMTPERSKIFRSAMSSKYSSITGRSDTQLEEIDRRVVELESYFFNFTLNLVLSIHDKFAFSEVVTVNGRYIVDGAVVQACKELEVKCSLMESAGSTPGSYEVYEISPHDIPSVQKLHINLWEGAGSGRNLIAEKGLSKKLSGLDSQGFDFRANFTNQFSQDHNPKSLKLAVFFPSTEREFAVFPDFVYRNSFGGSQGAAFLSFSRIAKANGYQVVVRVHPPNSKSTTEMQSHFVRTENSIWKKLCEESDTEFIESQSSISSYDLIDKADLCATYASSISVECILQGKPTLILGESHISYCVPEICAFNEAELETKFNLGIPVINKEALYPYGYWLESAGKKPKLFHFSSDEEVYFEGQLVNDYKLWAKPLIVLKKKIRASLGTNLKHN